MRVSWAVLLVAVLAVVAIGVAAERLRAAGEGVRVEEGRVGATPVTVFRPEAQGGPAAAVVIAHGFSGSRTLMAPLATAIARAGFVAVAFDFLGHGEHPAPLPAGGAGQGAATAALLGQTAEVAAFAAGLEGTDGRMAVLGHSMGSDIAVRFAAERPEVGATVAVSMYSTAVTATAPQNLLIVVGGWEGRLKTEALRAAGLATAPEPAREGVTTGDFGAGTARRVVFADGSEHVAVLFDPETLAETAGWLRAAFGVEGAPAEPLARLPWMGLLVAGVVALAWPLSRLLPTVAQVPAGAGLGWGRLWPAVVVPAVVTPLVLFVVPTDVLPVAIGDYLAAHFLLFGALAAGLAALRGGKGRGRVRWGALLAAAVLVTGYVLGGLGVVIDATITSFELIGARVPLFAVLFAGILAYFAGTEWATRGAGAARGGMLGMAAGLLLSLAAAVALQPRELFFLALIVPVLLLFFVICGLYSRWAYRTTGHFLPAAVGNAALVAWATTVTFPLFSG